MFVYVDWRPYTLGERSTLFSNHLLYQQWMTFARVPCICFEVTDINQANICFKQLVLEKEVPSLQVASCFEEDEITKTLQKQKFEISQENLLRSK